MFTGRMMQPGIFFRLICLFALGVFLSLSIGCGAGAPQISGIDVGSTPANDMGGILHGGPNPIVGAAITLYTTTSNGYGSTASQVTSTSTDSSGNFHLTLPTDRIACPSGEFAYVGAYSGSTGTTGTNNASLLMVPIGLCDTFYTSTNTGGVYTNTYQGQSLWIDELSTAVSAYALSGFMSVTNDGTINIGSPVKNHSTASFSTPSAAGLSHAFANALSIINNHTGQPYAYTNGGSNSSSGGVIPVAEISLLGNILQSCVNSAGPTGTNTSTSNDGTGCGKLFSFVTPPQAGAAVPVNTLQAMLDLAKYPNPMVNTWDTTCKTSGAGSKTATSCIYDLAAPSAAYANPLGSAPPDWALAIVYDPGYGVQTAGCSSTCPGLTYPFHLALDYEDNVYVLNWNAATATAINIIGIANNGSVLFSGPQDAANSAIQYIGTDTAGHVIGANHVTSGQSVDVYSANSGSLLTSVTSSIGAGPLALVADPFNNLWVTTSTGSSVRELIYNGNSSSPAYSTHLTVNSPASIAQIGFDSNLNLYMLGKSSSPAVYFFANTNSTSVTPAFAAAPTSTATITGDSTNAFGLGITSTGNAFAIDSVGVTPITKSGSGTSSAIVAGSSTSLPAVYNSTLNSRYVSMDGRDWVYSADNANGSVASGVTVYDSTDGLALGTYKGCYIVSNACSTSTSATMFSPRGEAIDSSGDIWVVSGASANLTELVGAAAPAWPAPSMAKSGLPQ